MVDSPHRLAPRGAAMAGPPLSATPHAAPGATGHPYPAYVYSFWDDRDDRCLYVGKAGAGPSGPAMRIRSHYLNREPWALEATTIRVQAFPGLVDAGLIEERMIRALKPRGNKQMNWRHHDRAWMAATTHRHRTEQAGPVEYLRTIRLVAVARARAVVRLLVTVLAVDVVVAVLVLLAYKFVYGY